jgi:hypothetical protein
MVQGAQSLSGNCLLHSAITSSISSVRLAHPPDLAGALEAKVNMAWLVEASWPSCVDDNLPPKRVSELASGRDEIEGDRTGQWTVSRIFPC